MPWFYAQASGHLFDPSGKIVYARVQALDVPNVTTGAPTTPGDQAVALSVDVPSLIVNATSLDPALAAQWTGMALIWSKTPWGTVACSAVAWLAARYGLSCSGGTNIAGCWSADTVNLVGGLAAMGGAFVGSYLMRLVTKFPVTGFFTPATPAQAIAKLERTYHARDLT
jgi:hypothetical protein